MAATAAIVCFSHLDQFFDDGLAAASRGNLI
jgi:hypothetical protein